MLWRGIAFQSKAFYLLMYILFTTTSCLYSSKEEVCGTDGWTYDSEKELRSAQSEQPDLLLLHKGPCSKATQKLLLGISESKDEEDDSNYNSFRKWRQLNSNIVYMPPSPKNLRNKTTNYIHFADDNGKVFARNPKDALRSSDNILRWGQQNPYQQYFLYPCQYTCPQMLSRPPNQQYNPNLLYPDQQPPSYYYPPDPTFLPHHDPYYYYPSESPTPPSSPPPFPPTPIPPSFSSPLPLTPIPPSSPPPFPPTPSPPSSFPQFPSTPTPPSFSSPLPLMPIHPSSPPLFSPTPSPPSSFPQFPLTPSPPSSPPSLPLDIDLSQCQLPNTGEKEQSQHRPEFVDSESDYKQPALEKSNVETNLDNDAGNVSEQNEYSDEDILGGNLNGDISSNFGGSFLHNMGGSKGFSMTSNATGKVDATLGTSFLTQGDYIGGTVGGKIKGNVGGNFGGTIGGKDEKDFEGDMSKGSFSGKFGIDFTGNFGGSFHGKVKKNKEKDSKPNLIRRRNIDGNPESYLRSSNYCYCALN